LRPEVELAETLLAEFLAAETIVIGAPMYNFSIPSSLKAWIDRVVLRGRTFSFTAEGPKGLAGGRASLAK
jgi:FMN-dependent NADH-azoreductase